MHLKKPQFSIFIFRKLIQRILNNHGGNKLSTIPLFIKQSYMYIRTKFRIFKKKSQLLRHHSKNKQNKRILNMHNANSKQYNLNFDIYLMYRKYSFVSFLQVKLYYILNFPLLMIFVIISKMSQGLFYSFKMVSYSIIIFLFYMWDRYRD